MSAQKISRLLLLALLLFDLGITVSAEVPDQINYQGRLTDDAGEPLSDGDYTIFFVIYDAPSDGNILWSSDRVIVPVENGLFNVELGPMDPEIFATDGDRYLGIRIESDPEIDPRTHLLSVPYALNAAGGGGWIDDGTTVRLITSSDFVGIGTDSPTSKLSVMAGDETAGYFQSGGQHALRAYTNTAGGMANVYGVYGRAAGGDGSNKGVYGLADGSSNAGVGVLGYAHSNANYSYGVMGRADSETGPANYHFGVHANADNGLIENTGVYASAAGSGTTNYGIYATASGGSTNYAGYFDGDVHITGTLTGGRAMIPPGGIIMWSGSSADMPEGWVLCDGREGTPDLSEKFEYEIGPDGRSNAPAYYKIAYIMKL